MPLFVRKIKTKRLPAVALSRVFGREKEIVIQFTLVQRNTMFVGGAVSKLKPARLTV